MLDLRFKWEYDVHLFTFNFIYMKAIIFATLLVCLLAATPFDKVNAIARQDECVAKTLDLIKPEIDAKVEELKQVPLDPFRTTTSRSRLISSL